MLDVGDVFNGSEVVEFISRLPEWWYSDYQLERTKDAVLDINSSVQFGRRS
jgi:hypothetical protein